MTWREVDGLVAWRADHERPDDWHDPCPRSLAPWCLNAVQVGEPFAGIQHGRCPGGTCGCRCHGRDEGDG